MADHPMHHTEAEVAPGIWEPSIPLHPKGVLGWQTRRACRKRGGHWWHCTSPMGAWNCCQCGAFTEGNPKDGR